MRCGSCAGLGLLFMAGDGVQVRRYLYMAGDEASGKQRLTFHPGHFNVLGSPNPTVVNKTIINTEFFFLDF